MRLSHNKDGQVFDVWALAWTTDAPIVRVWLESDGPSRYRKCFVSQGPSAARTLAECATFVDEKDQFNRDLFDRMLGFDLFRDHDAFDLVLDNSNLIPEATQESSERGIAAFAPLFNAIVHATVLPTEVMWRTPAFSSENDLTGSADAADRTMSSTAWTADWRTAEAEQRVLSELVETTPLALASLSHCWALGVAYSESRRLAVAIGVRCHLDGRTVDREVRVATQEVTFPYVPGLFAYREGPALTALLDGLGERPDLAIMDVQGVAHPRGIGLAAHVGALYDIPTIGITRKRLWGRHERVPA